MNGLRVAFDLCWDAVERFIANDGFAIAGYIAFSAFFALFPFLLFSTTLVGLLIGDGRTDEIVAALFRLAPEHVAMTLTPVVDEVIGGSSRGVLTVAAIVAIWVASNAVEAIRSALDRAYGVYVPRGIIVNRLIAIGFVFIGTVVAFLLGFSILLAPLIIRLLQDFANVMIPNFAALLSYAFGVMVFALFLRLMHRWLPGRSMQGAPMWPGVLLSTFLWVVAASGFSDYLSYTPTYTITYGALAGVIITMMFFYITALAIILGAEFNASLKARRDLRFYGG